MKKEIERRFLVNSDKLPILKRGKLINQGYLAKLSETTSPIVRIRQTDKRAFLTIKLFKSNLTKLEFEYPIPIKEAERLFEGCLASVQKIRYSEKIGTHTWEIDVYEGDNFPLVVAEIELKSETEAFQTPLWLEKEVTNDLRFHAYQLAINPFSKWRNG